MSVWQRLQDLKICIANHPGAEDVNSLEDARKKISEARSLLVTAYQKGLESHAPTEVTQI